MNVLKICTAVIAVMWVVEVLCCIFALSAVTVFGLVFVSLCLFLSPLMWRGQ